MFLGMQDKILILPKSNQICLNLINFAQTSDYELTTKHLTEKNQLILRKCMKAAVWLKEL